MSEALRLFVIVTSITGGAGIVLINSLLARDVKRGDHKPQSPFDFGYVMARSGIVVVLLCIAYGTAEAGLAGIPVGPRNVVLACGLVWLNVGTISTLVDRKHRRR